MTDITVAVTAGADDYYSSPPSFFDAASTSIRIGGSAAVPQTGGALFRNVAIPAAATITTCFVRFTGAATDTRNGNDVIRFEYADDPTNPTDYSGVASRTRTTASVTWPAASPTSGVTIDTPDLSTVLQEVIDRPGWVSGNNVHLLIDWVSGNNDVQLASFNHATLTEPVLHVTFAENQVTSARVKAEFNFGGSWFDVTSWVRDWDVRRGRPNQVEVVPPGVAIVTLDNRDRRFEPMFGASPYHPNVVPNVEFRLTGTYAGTDYRLFHGFVDGWPVEWPVDNVDATVTVRAFDFASSMHRTQTPQSYRDRVKADSPREFWPLEESQGSAIVSDAGLAGQMLTGDFTLQYNMGVLDYDHRGVEFQGHAGARFGTVHQLDMSGNQSIELFYFPKVATSTDFAVVNTNAWVSPVEKNDTQYFVAFTKSNPDNNTVRYLTYGWHVGDGVTAGPETTDPNAASVHWRHPLGTDAEITTPIHVVVTRNVVTQTVRFYVDGEEVNAIQRGVWVDPPTFDYENDPDPEFAIGGWPYQFAGVGVGCRLSHIAIYDYLLSPQQITRHYNAPFDRWKSQNTGARINDILDQAGWPTAGTKRDIDAGTDTLAATPIDSTLSLLQQAQKVAQTENGVFWIAPNGYTSNNTDVAAFATRASRYNPTAASTYGDNGTDQFYQTLIAQFDDEIIYNDITINTSDTQTSVDAPTSIATYGRRTYSRDIFPTEDTDYPYNLANWLLNRHKNPRLRFRHLLIIPDRDPARAWQRALDYDIGTCIQIKRNPPGGGATISQTVFIEWVRHTGDATGKWETEWIVSQASGNDVFIVQDATFGQLGQYPLAL